MLAQDCAADGVGCFLEFFCWCLFRLTLLSTLPPPRSLHARGSRVALLPPSFCPLALSRVVVLSSFRALLLLAFVFSSPSSRRLTYFPLRHSCRTRPYKLPLVPRQQFAGGCNENVRGIRGGLCERDCRRHIRPTKSRIGARCARHRSSASNPYVHASGLSRSR